MNEKIIIFGAGKIGRSFIGQLFSAGGYEVVFVDIAHQIVDALNARRKYEVVIKSTEDEVILVKNVRALDARNFELVVNEICEARILAVSVGKNALPAVLPLIAQGILKRFNYNRFDPVDIIIAENMLEASTFLKGELQHLLPSEFPFDQFVGLIETSIGKMVPIVPRELIDEDVLRVYAEPYNTLILDKKAFRNPVPQIKGLAPKENIRAWVDRKLFIHNLGHAATAYWGYYFNPDIKYIWEALAIPSVYRKTRETMLQAAALLCEKYPCDFTQADLVQHIDDLLERFQNKALGDTIYRVGCDLKRKLGNNDRLVGPVKLAIVLNLPYDKILSALIVGCHFRARDENGLLHPDDEDFIKMYEKGILWILEFICGFDRSSYLNIIKEGQRIEEKLLLEQDF